MAATILSAESVSSCCLSMGWATHLQLQPAAKEVSFTQRGSCLPTNASCLAEALEALADVPSGILELHSAGCSLGTGQEADAGQVSRRGQCLDARSMGSEVTQPLWSSLSIRECQLWDKGVLGTLSHLDWVNVGHGFPNVFFSNSQQLPSLPSLLSPAG